MTWTCWGELWRQLPGLLWNRWPRPLLSGLMPAVAPCWLLVISRLEPGDPGLRARCCLLDAARPAILLNTYLLPSRPEPILSRPPFLPNFHSRWFKTSLALPPIVLFCRTGQLTLVG